MFNLRKLSEILVFRKDYKNTTLLNKKDLKRLLMKASFLYNKKVKSKQEK
jgi:hypothetical protein